MSTLLITILLLILALAGMIVFLMITEYKPAPVEDLSGQITDSKDSRFLGFSAHQFMSSTTRTLTCLTWNLGYAGLDRELDFFYDGGKMVNPPKEHSERALQGIAGTLAGYDTLDFIFLQEVDFDSKRSFHTNQSGVIGSHLPLHVPVAAVNYDCRFIPVPATDPMGKVKSGIVTFTRSLPAEATRHAYKANFGWPKRLVFLKRCFLVTRFNLENGKQLLMVNLHNSTFDADGALRLSEQAQLQEYLEAEYAKGNFVVAGGDWNMNPRGFAKQSIATGDRVQEILPPLGEGFMPGWQFAFDPTAPSNRNVDQPYSKGETPTTVIDFFLLSPNVRLAGVKTLDLGFEYSDHNPVLLTFQLSQ